MKTELTFNDLVVFLKENKKIILLTTILTTILLAGLGFYSSYRTQQTQQATEEVEVQLENDEELQALYNTPSNELTADEEETLREFLQLNAYFFRVYVEHENNNPVDSQVFLKEVILTEEIIEEVEERAGIAFTPSAKQALIVHNESSSGVHTVQIGTGIEENNIRLGQALIDVLNQQAHPVLEGKTVEVLDDEPQEVLEDVSELTATELTPVTTSMIVRNSILLAVVGLVIGLTLGVMASIAKVLMQKEVSIFYSYKRANTDKILHLNSIKSQNGEVADKDALTYTILQPSVNRRLVLSETGLNDAAREKFTAANDARLTPNDELVLSDNVISVDWKEPFDEVVIVVYKNKTTKKWYEIQRTLLANFGVPVKVVQV